VAITNSGRSQMKLANLNVGHHWTFRSLRSMSALPPKADIGCLHSLGPHRDHLVCHHSGGKAGCGGGSIGALGIGRGGGLSSFGANSQDVNSRNRRGGGHGVIFGATLCRRRLLFAEELPRKNIGGSHL
jgi:hypothetical protein